VNEVFLDVWRTAGKFQGRSQVATWLLALARHKALEVARRDRPSRWTMMRVKRSRTPRDDPEAADTEETERRKFYSTA